MGGRTETLPIFPLANVVLFPKLRVPLHLFEPRYRQLGRDAIDGELPVGMVSVRPEHANDLSGNPSIFAVGCAGRITSSKKLPDGRYDIVLEGSWRFRILEELEPVPGRLYRMARVQVLEDRLDDAEAPRLAALRERSAELVGELILRSSSGRPRQLPRPFLRDADDERFANALCNSLGFEAAEKQGLLEADSIAERLERLIQLLDFRLAELGAAGRPSSGSVH